MLADAICRRVPFVANLETVVQQYNTATTWCNEGFEARLARSCPCAKAPGLAGRSSSRCFLLSWKLSGARMDLSLAYS